MPFPLQRIQTDRGQEFFAYQFQQKLREYAIKFRPIKPRSPHLNGKVERSQKTDWEEFYSTVDLADPLLKNKLRQWQPYYNCERPHSSLANQTPDERRFDLALTIPFSDEIIEQYNPAKERIRAQSYRLDQSLHEHTSTPTTAATAASPSSHSSKPPKTKKVTAKASKATIS
jgi:hypothetical protein